jgi:hypothetical protein
VKANVVLLLLLFYFFNVTCNIISDYLNKDLTLINDRFVKKKKQSKLSKLGEKLAPKLKNCVGM